jgi:hypothetical protein
MYNHRVGRITAYSMPPIRKTNPLTKYVRRFLHF